MKKVFLFFVCVVFIPGVRAQITLNATYSNNTSFYLDKFPVSGYKLVRTDIPNLKIEIYNVNHTLFKTISIPPQTDPINTISYVSENLFDTDNLMEFALTTYSFSSGTFTAPASYYKYKFYIFKETGTQLMFRDSASIQSGGNTDIFNNSEGIFFDGTNTRMRLNIQTSTSNPNPSKVEFYTLPGSIPCAQCGVTGTITGISSPGNPGTNNPVFYPNPVTDQLKLKYELPPDYKNAEIKIYDLQGKLIETFKITNTFDFIYLPSDYNNGMYLYSLNVDGKIIKTEKILLNK